MNTVLEIVQALNSEIESGSQFNIIEEIAEVRVSESVFGTKYNYALAYMILHIHEMNDRSGSGGKVSWEKEGDLEKRYANTTSDDELKQTSWGNSFLALAKQCTGGSMSTRMSLYNGF